MKEMEYETVWVNELGISSENQQILGTIAKWTKFLSVLGFIFLGLSVIFILSAGILISLSNNYMESTSVSYPYHPGVFSWFYAAIYLIIIAIYFIPVYFLYRFSVNTKNALKLNDAVTLTKAFNFLKKHYVFIGIMTIVVLAFYLAAFLVLFFSMAAHAL